MKRCAFCGRAESEIRLKEVALIDEDRVLALIDKDHAQIGIAFLCADEIGWGPITAKDIVDA